MKQKGKFVIKVCSTRGKDLKELVHKDTAHGISKEHKNHDQCIGADQTGVRVYCWYLSVIKITRDHSVGQ